MITVHTAIDAPLYLVVHRAGETYTVYIHEDAARAWATACAILKGAF
jgi:hypothetical protein